MSVLIRSSSTATVHCLRQSQKFAYFHSRHLRKTSHLSLSQRFLQTMCQGHEEHPPRESTNTPASTSSEQSAQSEQKKKQKAEWKLKKQQLRKEQTPPATPPPPTHELIKTSSAKLANGTRYIDVIPHVPHVLTTDALPYLHDRTDVSRESKGT